MMDPIVQLLGTIQIKNYKVKEHLKEKKTGFIKPKVKPKI